MSNKVFETYSNIKVENDKNEAEAEYDDIDSAPLKEQKKIRYSQDTKYRRCLTIWVMHIIPIWLVMVFVLLCVCAKGICKLSDVVLSTLLATTTVNILGLANIVLKGMFLKEKKESQN